VDPSAPGAVTILSVRPQTAEEVRPSATRYAILGGAGWLLLVALGCYVLAKVFELYDRAFFEFTHQVVSGHTLKHLFAAAACFVLLRNFQTRRPIAG